MKNFVKAIALLGVLSGSVLAGSFPVPLANQNQTTNSVASGTHNGYIEAIVVDVTGTTTGALTIVSGRTGETILTETITADTVRRVRMPVSTTAGVELALGTNSAARFYLSNDTLTYTLAETAPVTNSYTITVITE